MRIDNGMIFQSAALFDSMTVLDNVMFPLNMFSNDTLRERTKRAMFCLDRVNLGEALFSRSLVEVKISSFVPSHSLCPS